MNNNYRNLTPMGTKAPFISYMRFKIASLSPV